MAQSGTLLAACKRSVACLVVANSLFPILPRRSYRSCTHHSLTRRSPRSDISVAREINERITSKKRVDRNGVSGREREKLARTRKRSFINEIGTSSRRRRERFTEYSLKREILLARGLEFGREGGRAIFGSALEQGKRLSRVSRTPPLLATEKPSRYRPELFDIWDEADRLLPNFFLPLPPVRKFPPERRQTRPPLFPPLFSKDRLLYPPLYRRRRRFKRAPPPIFFLLSTYLRSSIFFKHAYVTKTLHSNFLCLLSFVRFSYTGFLWIKFCIRYLSVVSN